MSPEFTVILQYGEPVLLVALIISVAVQINSLKNLTKVVDEMKNEVVYRENCRTRHKALDTSLSECREKAFES